MDGNGSMTLRRSLGAIFLLLSLGLAGSAPGQNQDPIQALKDTLTGGSSGQGGVLQDILGNGKGTKKQTDEKLNTPETIQPKTAMLMARRKYVPGVRRIFQPCSREFGRDASRS